MAIGEGHQYLDHLRRELGLPDDVEIVRYESGPSDDPDAYLPALILKLPRDYVRRALAAYHADAESPEPDRNLARRLRGAVQSGPAGR